MTLLDRSVLITGARRVGSTVAQQLALRGADVALTYRRSKVEAEETAALVRAHGRRAAIVQADLSQAADCARAVTEAASALGRLDVLVNMASVYSPKPFGELSEADLDSSLSVDLKAAYLCTLAAVPHMRARGGGRIINVADWLPASRRPRYKGYLTYYVAKASIIALTEACALELADEAILVNAIAPGPILAPADLPKEDFEAVEKATPVGRWGGEAEIAKAVISLVEADFITGETIRVDGGRHLR
jgi:NAD(P)-dependent dehydrogenase (short-subunit alcohol dehydrogenase family)